MANQRGTSCTSEAGQSILNDSGLIAAPVTESGSASRGCQAVINICTPERFTNIAKELFQAMFPCILEQVL